MERVRLPEPNVEGDISVERAIRRRCSRRQFADEPIGLEYLSQVLWCAQGITSDDGRRRAAPSAGATYPLFLYVAVREGGVTGVEAGIYRYVPADHSLEPHSEGDKHRQIAAAALNQDFLAGAPALILMAADYPRTTVRYGERGIRYVAMEAGHIGQNIYLQAEALGLGTVAIGAFYDDQLAAAFGLSDDRDALYLMSVGHPR
jgi:SagB-type dehydrogenase family enzyme